MVFMENYYKGKRVFVAGGAGFIGSHIVKKLSDIGAEVVFYRSNQLDLRDCQATYDAISALMPAVIINAAAVPNTSQILDIFDDQIKSNFVTALNLVKAAAENRVKKFVQIGSIAEYGNSPSPFFETMREQPTSPYSLSKIMATHAVLLYGNLSGMAVTVARPAAVFGPGQDFGLMLIPNIIKSVIDKKDFDMNPGDQIRDFIYVEDLVDGILKAGASSNSDQQIFNLGSNRGYKVKDIATTLNKLTGNSIRINFGAKPYRPLDVMECYMDSSKAENILGWKAWTPMEIALQQTVNWYNSNIKK